ncbi:hypothetical protein OF83DRAFT_1167437 [Amylostereum chailletii]|nr:hypothetical protein OF83DRAFT_1167437 [Amylostereum chailletii]
MTASQPSTPLSLPLKHPRNDSLYPSITDEEPPQTNKRRKQGTQNSWDHHPLWWKTDGSVIIRCGRTVFKLHKTILAGASPYFSELFQSSATESLEEIAGEKLPMYLIAFGNVPAFAHILNLLYNALEFMQHIPSDATLDLIVRASTALSFSTIRDWAGKLLEAQWSADVTQVTTTPAHRALETILLAKACRIPQILKRACYEAIRINTFGDTMRGPSLQEFHNANVVEATRTAEPFVRLSSKDVVALFRAHGRLSDEWVRCAATPPTEYRCSHGPQPVAYEPARWNTMVHASGLFVRYLHDPIAGIAEIRRNIILEEDVFCGACREAIEAAWKKSLETIWEQYDVGLEEDLLA